MKMQGLLLQLMLRILWPHLAIIYGLFLIDMKRWPIPRALLERYLSVSRAFLRAFFGRFWACEQ